MLGYRPGTFVEIIDLTNAIFKNLTLRDYHKELLVLTVAAQEQARYEWEQHVSVAGAAGVSERQFVAIAEGRFDDPEAFTEDERVFLRFGLPFNALASVLLFDSMGKQPKPKLY
jgi:hypothetical protein